MNDTKFYQRINLLEGELDELDDVRDAESRPPAPQARRRTARPWWPAARTLLGTLFAAAVVLVQFFLVYLWFDHGFPADWRFALVLALDAGTMVAGIFIVYGVWRRL